MKNRLFRYTLIILYALAIATLIYFFWHGFAYYMTPYRQRPHHPLYAAYRPAGSLGLVFGTIGTAMMLGLLLYILRKRTRLFGNLFHLGSWLSVHIFFGIMGPLFVLLHTSFKLNGIVAISFWAMFSVALSGVLGKYLYVQIPQNIEEDRQNLAMTKAKIDAFIKSFVPNSNQDPKVLAVLLEQISARTKPDALVSMIVRDFLQSWRWFFVRHQLTHQLKMEKSSSKRLLRHLKHHAKLERKLVRLDSIHRLFHYWHVIHRPFAAVMYLFMMVHIVIALLFGIGWKAS